MLTEYSDGFRAHTVRSRFVKNSSSRVVAFRRQLGFHPVAGVGPIVGQPTLNYVLNWDFTRS